MHVEYQGGNERRRAVKEGQSDTESDPCTDIKISSVRGLNEEDQERGSGLYTEDF